MEFYKAKEYLETAINVVERKFEIAKTEFERKNYVDAYDSLQEIYNYLDGLNGLHHMLSREKKPTVRGTLEEWEDTNRESE